MVGGDAGEYRRGFKILLVLYIPLWHAYKKVVNHVQEQIIW